MYTGSTLDLVNRVKQHRNGYQNGFTQKYNVNRVIFYEAFEDIDTVKIREKQVKGWKRERKVTLIESKNKRWRDLYDDLIRDPSSFDKLRTKP